MNPMRDFVPRRRDDHGAARLLVAAGTVALWLVVPAGTLSAQRPYLHLNPAIEKLSAGKPIIGTQTDDKVVAESASAGALDMDYACCRHEQWRAQP